jgi:anhydro-N-acetylmuramic acid kinase
LLYTKFLGEKINEFITENKLQNIDMVCSHGHTAIHNPDMGITYQLGNLSTLNNKYRIMTVCDFRIQDVALGGQGAPLVPVGDSILFSNYSACLNLGGFANISRNNNKNIIAYDLCSVNIVLNYLSNKTGKKFDKDGLIARSGKLIPTLLRKLNSIEFYSKNYPKSLGIEWVSDNIFPIINEWLKKSPLENVMHTYLIHVIKVISSSLTSDDNVLVSGGGAHNKYLMEELKLNSKAKIILPSKEIINFKEALIFGLLGLLRVLNINNCFSSITGARQNHCSGKIIK